jgi:hypothetical protein
MIFIRLVMAQKSLAYNGQAFSVRVAAGSYRRSVRKRKSMAVPLAPPANGLAQELLQRITGVDKAHRAKGLSG